MRHGLELYRAEQVRALDRCVIDTHGIPGYTLMQRAGAAVLAALRRHWPEARSLTICCGGGNNGGDGYVVARLARAAGFDVQVLATRAAADLGGDAARAAAGWLADGGEVGPPDEAFHGEVIVDALLGTGVDRPVAGVMADLIQRINACGRPVVAVDLPSGLNADTGAAMGECTRAALTVTLIGRKRGLYTGQAMDYRGQLLFAGLDVPGDVSTAVAADAELLEPDLLPRLLPPRPPATHKGMLGHVLVCGGDDGMPGAVMLAAHAALAAGSGLVSVATRAAHAPALAVSRPEAMWAGVESGTALRALLARADIVAAGPGLGQSDWGRQCLEAVLDSDRVLVLDADGLNLLASRPRSRRDWVLTPHPGEAARLLQCSPAAVQSDRFKAARALADRFDAVVVLKGAGTLIAAPDGRLSVCGSANPALATAGMGDALTGIIAAFAGQGMRLFDAAAAGVLAHALAGARAARGRRQILAGDLIAALPAVLPA